MANFQFELVSPERLLYSDEVSQVVVPGSEGDFAVLAGHAPVMSTIRPGILVVEASSGAKDFVLLGGFAEVGPDRLTVLAETAYDRGSVDREELTLEIQNARDDVADASSDDARSAAQERLDQLSQLESLL